MSISNRYTPTGFVPVATSNVNSASGASCSSGADGASGASSASMAPTATSGVTTRGTTTYTTRAPETSLAGTGPATTGPVSSNPVASTPNASDRPTGTASAPIDFFYGKMRTYYRDDAGRYGAAEKGPWFKDWSSLLAHWRSTDWEDSFITSTGDPSIMGSNDSCYIDPALESAAEEAQSAIDELISWTKDISTHAGTSSTYNGIQLVAALKAGNLSRNISDYKSVTSSIKQLGQALSKGGGGDKRMIGNAFSKVGTALSLISVATNAADYFITNDKGSLDAAIGSGVKAGLCATGAIGTTVVAINDLVALITGEDFITNAVTWCRETYEDVEDANNKKSDADAAYEHGLDNFGSWDGSWAPF